MREIAKHAAVGGRGPVVIGSPEEVAEELIAWVEDTDVDGFNLAYAVMPETFVDFVDLVVPELQRRGCYKRDYAPGTLREKLYGQGHARLGADHPAVRSAVLPIGREVDERVGRASATPRSGLDAISRSWREIAYLSSSLQGGPRVRIHLPPAKSPLRTCFEQQTTHRHAIEPPVLAATLLFDP